MKKKDMNFSQASTIYDLPLFADADNDKIPNVFDCKPFDELRDGLFGRAVNLFSRGQYGQSKEEYDAEKSSHTQFVRDERGQVIRIIRNGLEVEPDLQKMKSVKQLEREYAIKKFEGKLEKQKTVNAIIKQRMALQKLREKEQKLLEEQRMRSYLDPHPSTAQKVLSSMFGVRPQPAITPNRSGYYIEQVPSLPKGYRWKKIPKSKKGKSTRKPAVCSHCKTPLMPFTYPTGQLTWFCPRCQGVY